MPSRDRKEERLRHNVEVSTERWVRSEQQRLRTTLAPEQKRKMRKEFEESARRIDKDKLAEVWND